MLIAFDTEFIDDGKTIDLISIGMVRADGAVYYAQPSECDLDKAGLWVRANVLPHLDPAPDNKPRAQIAAEIFEFVGEKPKFWAYYAAYDWVALCQLYGTMMDLPRGWPKHCCDLKQAFDAVGNPTMRHPDDPHHALLDALWVMRNVRELGIT